MIGKEVFAPGGVRVLGKKILVLANMFVKFLLEFDQVSAV
jgi:hypothetical protein